MLLSKNLADHIKVAYIVLNKRHARRLFPTDKDDGRSGNVPHGTVVDTDITDGNAFDFLLKSQTSLIGTSRPAHYTVLIDKCGFGAAGLYLLTFWLAHLFCRATK